MGRYRIVADNGIYFTTHTIVEWLPVFRERKYFESITASLRHCQDKKGLTVFGYVIMKGFVEKPEDWLFSSARNYADDDHSILQVELLQMI